jgi:hypothetical protein
MARIPVAFFLTVALGLSLSGGIEAQEPTTGVIEGFVGDDASEPLVGAAVTIHGPQGVRSGVTDAKGRFVFRDLAPGTYTVKAELPDHATVTQTDVKVVQGKRTQVPFTLGSGLTESVTVTSEAPLVDMKSTTVGATVSVRDLVDYVPLPRQFSSMFSLAPSAVSGLGTSASNYAISGSSGFENAYFIDGINVTSSGYGAFGTYNVIYQSLSPGVTNDFIDQVDVKTAGIEAEFGQATGGIVSAVVRSGTNEFSGQVSAYATPAALQATRRLNPNLYPEAQSVLETSRLDFGLGFGGPFVTDKLFWYLAYNPVETETTYIRTVADESILYKDDGTLRDPEQPTGGRTETSTLTNHNYAGKLSWFVNPNHRIELTAFGDPSKGEYGAHRPHALQRTGEEGFSELDYGADNYSIKYSAALASNLFLDAIRARHDSHVGEVGVPTYLIEDMTAVEGGLYTGGLGWSNDVDERVDQLGLKLTVTAGDHEIKLGYQRDDTEYRELVTISGPTWTANIPVATRDATGEWVWDGNYFPFESTTGAGLEKDYDETSPSGFSYLVAGTSFTPPSVRTKNRERSFFIQDTWTVTPRLTLRLGARRTDAYVAGGTPFEYPFTLVPSGVGFQMMADLGTPTRFEPTAIDFSPEWAPRLGLIWDIRGDGRHKLYANYGRYVQRMTQRLAVRALTDDVSLEQTWADENLSVPYDTGFCPTDDGMESCHAIENPWFSSSEFWEGTTLPETEEFLLGYSHGIGSNMGFDVRYIHRELDNVIEDFSYIPQESIANFAWGPAIWVGPFDPYPEFTPALFGEYVLANVSKNSWQASIVQALRNGQTEIAAQWADGTIPDFSEPTRDYDAIELVFNKRMSQNWLMYVAYRYGRLYGNYEGLYRNDNGQQDPNITSLYDFPDTPLSSGQFINGRLNTDVKHNLNLFGTYAFPFGLDLGGAVRFSSGVPRFPLLTHPNGAYSIPGVGEVAGTAPVYGAWVALDGDPDNTVLTLAHGVGAQPSEMSDGTLDENGGLVFTEYRPGPADVTVSQWWLGGEERFLYSYTPVRRDCCGRTPDNVSVDLHLAYNLRLGWRNSTLGLVLDAFNIFNTQKETDFDDVLELERGEPNPNLGEALAYQEPRTLRVSLRWNF